MTQLVGHCDIRILSNGKADSKTPSEVLLRAYYPVDTKSSEAKTTKYWLHNRVKWLPSTKYFHGIIEYAKPKGSAVIKFFAPLFHWFLRQPAYFHPSECSVPAMTSKQSVILFSHGLGGFRGMYSEFCASMAMKGHIVLALEHGDGSACYFDASKDENGVYYSGYPKENGWSFRREQLAFRSGEIKTCLEALGLLENKTSRSFVLETTNDDLLSCIKEANDVHFAGHSFGAATLINYLTHDHKDEDDDAAAAAVSVCLMDPWLEPLLMSDTEKAFKDHTNFRSKMSKHSLAVINSDSFHWKNNLDIIQLILDAGPCEPVDADHQASPDNRSICLNNTSHVDFSDIPFRIPFMEQKKHVVTLSADLFHMVLQERK
jgi:platelet-activating factor acetylhydrolase